MASFDKLGCPALAMTLCRLSSRKSDLCQVPLANVPHLSKATTDPTTATTTSASPDAAPTKCLYSPLTRFFSTISNCSLARFIPATSGSKVNAPFCQPRVSTLWGISPTPVAITTKVHKKTRLISPQHRRMASKTQRQWRTENGKWHWLLNFWFENLISCGVGDLF